MAVFKNISYPKQIFEYARNHYSINKNNVLSDFYIYLLACIYPLQSPMNDFFLWREEKRLIATCKWQIGQVLNVLNYLFDKDLKRIYIVQRTNVNLFAIDINFESDTFAFSIDDTINDNDNIYASDINDTSTISSEVNFKLPSDIYNDELKKSRIVSVIEQIRIDGINYIISEI